MQKRVVPCLLREDEAMPMRNTLESNIVWNPILQHESKCPVSIIFFMYYYSPLPLYLANKQHAHPKPVTTALSLYI